MDRIPAGSAESRLNQLALRVATAAAAAVVLVTTIVAIAGGDLGLLWSSALAASVALVAWWLHATQRSAMPLMFLACGVIVAAVAIRRHPNAVMNGTFGLIAVAMMATMLARGRIVILAMAAVVLAALSSVRIYSMGDRPADVLVGALVPLALVILSVQVIHWGKREITGRQHSYSNLFEHVPVAIWEEDFSKVAVWLEQLRELGVVDLREYLATNPDTVRFGASLIEVTDVNDETLSFLNAESREDVLGPLNPDLLVEDSFGALVEEIVAVWEGRPKLRIDMVGANLSGDQIEGYLLLAAPQTPTGIDWSRVVVVMVDVSEQLAAQRRLQELVDSKDRFVASVSHELRTPLTSVIGLAEELRNIDNEIPSDEREELLALIADQAIEVGNIVEDLLVSAQSNIGRVKVLLGPVSLSSEVNSLLGLMNLPRQPEVDIVDDIYTIADAQRLRQILRNLVSNAYRYGGESVVLSARVEESTMVLEVRDNGDGIPEELRDRVFEPYESAHQIDGLTESFGLGLTISRELAKIMSGDISYYRTGGFTVFQLTLPAVIRQSAIAPAAVDESVATSF